jgi:acylphosphatase
MKRIHIYVSGTVQGVYFRYNAVMKAEELGLKGWVRNLWDGRVEIVCEGTDISISQMIEWCRSGPRGAHVENLETRWEDFRGEFDDFQIVR